MKGTSFQHMHRSHYGSECDRFKKLKEGHCDCDWNTDQGS